MGNNNVLLYLGIGVIALLALGVIEMPSWGGGDDAGGLYPSDLKTTVTLNTGNKLATTATNANVSYYIFDSAGNYLKEGTTSAGTASFTVPTGGKYTLIAYADGTGTDYLPVEIDFSTDGDDLSSRAVKTVNIDLMRESNTTINAVQDPVDLNANLSVSAGATVNFNLLISAEISNAAINKPVVRLEYNNTNIETSNCPTLSEVTCPDKIGRAHV